MILLIFLHFILAEAYYNSNNSTHNNYLNKNLNDNFENSTLLFNQLTFSKID